jgi:hypothetical protein
MIDELVRYKQMHYPEDRRRILTCGVQDGKVRVAWLNVRLLAASIPSGTCSCTDWSEPANGTKRSASC